MGPGVGVIQLLRVRVHAPYTSECHDEPVTLFINAQPLSDLVPVERICQGHAGVFLRNSVQVWERPVVEQIVYGPQAEFGPIIVGYSDRADILVKWDDLVADCP